MLDCQIRPAPPQTPGGGSPAYPPTASRAHNGGDLRLDVRPDHVDAGGLGPEAHPIAPPCLMISGSSSSSSPASGMTMPYPVARTSSMAAATFCSRPGPWPAPQQAEQLPVVVDGEPRLLGHGLVEEAPGQVQPGLAGAGAQAHGGDGGLRHRLALAQGLHHRPHIPDPVEPVHVLPNGLENLGFDGVVLGQGVHPVGEEELELLQRELEEHRLDDLGHRPLAQVQAAHRQAGDVVGLRQLGPQSLGLVGLRPGGS